MMRRLRTVSAVCAAVLALVYGAPTLQAAPKRVSKTSAARSSRPAVKSSRPVVKATASRTVVRAKAVAARPAPAFKGTTSARRRVLRARAAAAKAREARELTTPRFKVDDAGREVPDPRAAAAIIYDPETNEVLFQENATELRSMASITKVMTALVFLESLADPSLMVKVERPDVLHASTTYLRAGYNVTVEQLLHLLLIGSDNAAARVLARVSPYGSEGFIARMNEKARELGLQQTHYEDPSGLLSGNVSSAYDLARLISYASADDRIGGLMRKSEFDFTPGTRSVHVSSTNRLVRQGEIDILGGKTGFISSSGYCLATLVRVPQTGRQLAMVVLGARSNAARFAETKHLYNWVNAHEQTVAGSDGAQALHQQQ
ncbi:MAG: serine hydrolase [Acidobacteriota bacterium]